MQPASAIQSIHAVRLVAAPVTGLWSLGRHSGWWRKLLWAVLLAVASGLAQAQTLQLTNLPKGSLGEHARMLVEDGRQLTLEEARAQLREGRFRQGDRPVLNYGIGSRPVWVHLEVFNPGTTALAFRLVAGTAWIDQIDVFVVHNNQVSSHWQTGDENPYPYGLTPGVGFTFDPQFAPGRSELYLRVQTNDVLVLPLELTPATKAVANERFVHYGYGFLYGFLFALFAYNSMLFAGLRERSYLYYSLYLAILVLLNMAYTGHGNAWLWSGQPWIQQYVILVLMVLFGSSGLIFASRFLALGEHAPRVLRTVRQSIWLGLGLMGLCIATGYREGAALLAFSFLSLFTLGMAGLGILTVRHGRVAGRYFLAAALCGMVGTITTTLAAWGWLPFTPVSYHAVEVGIVVEATLLALALTHQMRQYQLASLRATQLAGIDPLTGLHNRRAFLERTGPIWSTAVRNERPLTVIMLDIDHFKRVNDQYGHETGDHALVAIARQLALACRDGDILARWGGEEFMLLLPETSLEQARSFAERLRQSIEAQGLPTEHETIVLTASFGVAERRQHSHLEDLINEADVELYKAKQGGRNRVSCEETALNRS